MKTLIIPVISALLLSCIGELKHNSTDTEDELLNLNEHISKYDTSLTDAKYKEDVSIITMPSDVKDNDTSDPVIRDLGTDSGKDMGTDSDKDTGPPQNSTFAEKIKKELAIDLEAQKTYGTQNYAAGQNRPIKTTQNGQTIKNKIIYANIKDPCGIKVDGHDDVKIENVTIYHANVGICVSGAKGIKIKNIRLINLAAPDSGPHCVRDGNKLKPSKECWGTRNASADRRLGIYIKNSSNATVTDIYAAQASSGVYAVSSPKTHISEIRCFDSRGPFPRGQCVQFNGSNDSSVTTFYAKAYFNQSHSEDTFNAYNSHRVKFEDGLVDGNYSINGVGIIADSGSDDMIVHDVDIIHSSVSGVSVYANKAKAKNFKGSKIRVKDTQCHSRKGGKPSSGGLVIAAQPGTPNFSFDDVIFWNHCRGSGGAVWCRSGDSGCKGLPEDTKQGGSMTNIREQNFKTRWTNQ